MQPSRSAVELQPLVAAAQPLASPAPSDTTVAHLVQEPTVPAHLTPIAAATIRTVDLDAPALDLQAELLRLRERVAVLEHQVNEEDTSEKGIKTGDKTDKIKEKSKEKDRQLCKKTAIKGGMLFFKIIPGIVGTVVGGWIIKGLLTPSQ